NETIVRLVVIERTDDVIAVPPGVRADRVVLETVALREAGEIEPVSSPTLAVMRRGEQAIDELLVGVGRGVVHEGIDFRRRWRQADEIERNPANENLATGGNGRDEAVRFLRRENKSIDRVFRPGGVFNRRR